MEKQFELFPPVERLLNYEQLQEKLGGITRRTIDRWLSEGIFPAGCKVLISGSARFRESAVDEWIRAGCRGAGDE
ncbi:MAG: helix-turn-helix domain-containing protein [Planctomycetales bacterium]|nr:helix-turn-helix domain-containing protein [Planctomycetales bacterium]